MSEVTVSRFKIETLNHVKSMNCNAANVYNRDADGKRTGFYTNITMFVIAHHDSLEKKNWSYATVLRFMDAKHNQLEQHAHFFDQVGHCKEFRDMLFNNDCTSDPGTMYSGRTMQEMGNIKA